MNDLEIRSKKVGSNIKVSIFVWALATVGFVFILVLTRVYFDFSRVQAAVSITAKDYQYLSDQDFSATAIDGLITPSDCSPNDTGQIILLTDIDLSKEKGLQTAIYNGSTWTKRGKLFPLESNVKSAIIKKLKDENSLDKVFGTTNETTISQNLVSGAYFAGVPTREKLNTLIYAGSWSGKVIKIEGQNGPAKACENVIYVVKKPETNKMSNEWLVCVSSTDESKNFVPKKTFSLPKEESDLEKYKKENGSVISLGPCQNDDAVKANVAAGNKPSDLPAGTTVSGNGTGGVTANQSATATAVQAPGSGVPSGNTGQDPLHKGQAPAIGAADITADPSTVVLPQKKNY